MLTGTLDDFTLPDVLRLIASARRTGGLSVTRDGGSGKLYFRDGTVSRGVPAYDRRTPSATPAGAAEDLAFDLMRWDRGEFTWTAGPPSSEGPDAGVDVDDLLREVTRRLEELAEIQTLVPSETAVLTMAPQPPEGAVQINITPAEWRVLVLVDGQRSVTEIAAATHLDDLDAMKLLYGLAAAGLVTCDPRNMSDLSDAVPEDTFGVVESASAAEPEVRPFAGAFRPPAEAMASPEELSDTSDTTAVSVAPPEDTLDALTEAGEPEEVRDPFLGDLSTDPVSPFDSLPLTEDPHDEGPTVDRSTAARELAGLFEEGNGHSTLGGAVVDPTRALGGMAVAGPPAPPRLPRRVEDDDQVTRGLISRLIDGVKGL